VTRSLGGRRPRRRPEVWLRHEGDGGAVYDPDTAHVHPLNPSALAIWHLCDGETEPEEMVAAICQVSKMHPDVVADDVARTLVEFHQAGLLAPEE
jgi:Coenzyme PQQ synthesis protein D (PqqD)